MTEDPVKQLEKVSPPPRLSAEAVEKILDALPDALVVVDMNENGKIVFVNGRAEFLFGYERTELLGQSVDILIPGRLKDNHKKHRQHYIQDPEIRPMGAGKELYCFTKDGREVPVDIMLAPVMIHGGGIVAVAIRRRKKDAG